MFSCGIIFYLILTGKSPFEGKNFRDVLQLNKECNINYDAEELKEVPPVSVDLL